MTEIKPADYWEAYDEGYDAAILATRKSTLEMIIKALSDSPIVTVAGKGGALEFLRGVRGDLEE